MITHLEQTFQTSSVMNSLEELNIMNFLDRACPMDLPIKSFSPREVQKQVVNLSNKKSSGYDKLRRIAKSLSRKCIIFLTLLYNAVIRLSHFFQFSRSAHKL